MDYTGSGLKDLILGIAGNIFIGVLAIGAVVYWSKTEWGRFITLILGAIIVAAFVWMPDQTITFFRAIGQRFFGS